ncbi:MAG: tRNA (N6-threonylcarbamoyladenosine(37)-N6)-methyltransferase TrmO [Clostridia bacterium]|jgi:tRNA-Thr(GGU) m(6)t(6)A37 methyltransferase TsaA|nr:tRNA (N6-threonylcarbamoyladenosine(37)-N6)-methyltransferase TrmO [Clostridia bacterium]
MSKRESYTIEPIAFISNGYNEKFGVPRQSGLANSVKSVITFTEGYTDENCLRGIEQYSHLWLIWGFSENDGKWSATVRPPKLGGNKRTGVFATRSPFRPNGLGLSCVKLEGVEKKQGCNVLIVSGADLKNGTPVFDIKPYLPYVDSIPDAMGGFSDEHSSDFCRISFECETFIPEEDKNQIEEILSLDPKPQYQTDECRVYGLSYKNYNVKFMYQDERIIVKEISETE